MEFDLKLKYYLRIGETKLSVITNCFEVTHI